MEPKQSSLLVVSALVAGVIAAGTAFYALYLELSVADAVYLTVMTVATVGYGDLSPLARAKEIGADPAPAEFFTVLLILVGMGVLAYAATLFTEFVISGEYAKERFRRRVQRRIDALRGHYVVCGAGELGDHVLTELAKTHRPFVLVEENPEAVRRLEERRPGLLAVTGDPGDEETLGRAGVERAAGVILAHPDERENLMVALAVKARCEAAGAARPRIVSRVADLERTGPRLLASGADAVVSPSFIGGRRMVSELLKPQVTTVLDRMLADPRVDVRIDEARVSPGGPLDGATLGELALARLRARVES